MTRKERATGQLFLRSFKTDRINQMDEMGKRNEQRALIIMEEVKADGLIKAIKRATPKQDRKGIDVWVYPNSSIEGLRVPFQVKSSAYYAIKFRESRVSLNEIAVLVVNDFVADDDLKSSISESIKGWIAQNVLSAGMAEVVNAPV